MHEVCSFINNPSFHPQIEDVNPAPRTSSWIPPVFTRPADGMPIPDSPERASLNGALVRRHRSPSATLLCPAPAPAPLWSRPPPHLNMDTKTEDVEGCYKNRSVKFFYEASGKNISALWRDRDYVIVSLGMAVCFIVIFSNLLVIGAILKNRRFHFPIYYLLGNLAMSDLFSGTALFTYYYNC